MFGDEVGLADEALPGKVVAVVDVGEQVLDVERAADVVHLVLVDRDAREARLDDDPLDVLVALRNLDGRDVDARLHDFLHLGIGEVDDAREHLVLLGRGALRHVDGIGQLVQRELAAVGRLLADAAARADQNVGERVENPAQHQQRTRREAGEAHRHRLSEDLGENLAEEQQQEGHQHALEEELEAQEGEGGVDDVRRQDDDADVDQVVDHQNRGQQQFDVAQQFEHPFARSRAALADAAHVVVREREKEVSAPDTSAETISRQSETMHSTTVCVVTPLNAIQEPVSKVCVC